MTESVRLPLDCVMPDRRLNPRIATVYDALEARLQKQFQLYNRYLPGQIEDSGHMRLYLLGDDAATPTMVSAIERYPGAIILCDMIEALGVTHAVKDTDDDQASSLGARFQTRVADVNAVSSAQISTKLAPTATLNALAQLIAANKAKGYPTWVEDRFLTRLAATPLASVVAPLALLAVSNASLLEPAAVKGSAPIMEGEPLSPRDLIDPAILCAVAANHPTIHYGPAVADPRFIRARADHPMDQDLARRAATLMSPLLRTYQGPRLVISDALATATRALMESQPRPIGISTDINPPRTQAAKSKQATGPTNPKASIYVGSPPGRHFMRQEGIAPSTKVISQDAANALSKATSLSGLIIAARLGFTGPPLDLASPDDHGRLRQLCALQHGAQDWCFVGPADDENALAFRPAPVEVTLRSLDHARWQFDASAGLCYRGDPLRGWVHMIVLAGGAKALSVTPQSSAGIEIGPVFVSTDQSVQQAAPENPATIPVHETGLAFMSLTYEPDATMQTSKPLKIAIQLHAAREEI